MFFKKKEIPTKEIDYFRAIGPEEMQDIREYDKDAHFWDGRAPEEQILEYVKSDQPLIDEFQETGEVLVQYPYPDQAAREKAGLKELIFGHGLQNGREIRVTRKLDGTFIVSGNGRHRMYVARKYGLKLLVHVIGEEIEK